ncbi:MAG: hypothetical protein GY778_02555 [bacterium]|nr:hypothetical protein [bacterium]
MQVLPIVFWGAIVAGLDTPPGQLASPDYLLSRLPVLSDCLSGPDALPSPPGPTTTIDCLVEFDHDEDGDVDLRDYSKALTGAVQPDFWETDSQGGRLNFALDPLPAGFFDHDGMSCDAFAGEILFEGVPLDPDLVTAADTIVVRAFDPIQPSEPMGTTRSVPIELVALNMESIAPITVICDGQPVDWNARSEISTTVIGTMSVLKTHDNGGTADVSLPLLQLLTFTKPADPAVQRVLDAAAQGLDPVVFTSTLPWSHSADPADPFGPPGFIVGVDTSIRSGNGCVFNTEHVDPVDVLPGGETVYAHKVCPADRDNDRINDIDDNCPTIPNTDQADADLDHVGDVCDGGTFSGTGDVGAPGACISCVACNMECTVCGVCGAFPDFCPEVCEQCSAVLVEFVVDILPGNLPLFPSDFVVSAEPVNAPLCIAGFTAGIDTLGNIFWTFKGITVSGFLDHAASPRTLTVTISQGGGVFLETYTLIETSP